MRNYIAKFVGKLLFQLNKKDIELEHQRRQEIVGDVVYKHLCAKYPDLMVIEQGKFNFFSTTSGDLPIIDFYIPSLNLFILIGRPETGLWEEARLLGITREDWENAQSELTTLTEFLRSQTTEEYKMVLVVINWTNPCNVQSLLNTLANKGVIN